MEQVDAVVVGSGFGGSVAAARLACAGQAVVVLERGKPYPPGSFARSPREMSRNFWDPSKGLHGLFDVWSFRGLEAVVSAGLGGGSLIYANVLIRKDEKWFVREDPSSGSGYEYWPVTRAELDPHYETAETMLGARRFPMHRSPYSETPKTVAMRAAAERLEAKGRRDLQWYLPNLAVDFGPEGAEAPGAPIPGSNLHGPDAHRRACRLCGECDIGCNDGAKNTLDYNYLTLADSRGADIRTRHEVTEIEPHPDHGWVVTYRNLTDYEGTNPKHAPTGRIHSKVLVLSAGALGSTYLLLKNQERLGHLPPAIGSKFCGNGDLLGFLRAQRGRVLDGANGPVITSTMRVGDDLDDDPTATGRGFYLQDGGYPEFASWLAETSILNHPLRRARRMTRAAWSVLADRLVRGERTSALGATLSQMIGNASMSAGVLPVLGMGRDIPDGVMRLDGKWLDVEWNVESSRSYFERVHTLMEEVSTELDAELSLNPTFLLSRVVTVHPLGGCPMGTSDNPTETGAPGVVDDHGEVFGHKGLFVADGAVMPGPVGANPSLTIAALAERFSTRMIERSEHV